ncbi:RHS repeat-associated core domain-containing protein [Kitasatospora sp. NBC_01287]|uniref:RHS repeat-associated core domain-containing protein n=1 Tax=Kitasatospora sp. NBC_01287 TaxID=2903573 RepID=UPI002258BC59|nr:RHS repeat-associated core domain-containing protein [Kitasatospora sp. NBC_01287]MCX4744488.1 RHS repeat-associated core domain-containing protein [Kitasatospora sp. NBC_01287]
MLQYNNLGQVAASQTTLTGPDSGLVPAAGLTTTYGYSLTGKLSTLNDPTEGGLPAEGLTYGYDQFGEPISVISSGLSAAWSYVSAVGYNEFGQPLRYTLGPTSDQVWEDYTYDPQTGSATDVQTSASAVSGVIDALHYTYGNSAGTVSKGAGLLTATTDTQNAGSTTDTQCYQYDYAARIQQAWSATDNCAATPTPGSSASVGGPQAPYWQSWSYDAAGNRLTQTDHDTTGNTGNDTTTTYAYPTAGTTGDQPHTLTATTASGPNAAADTASYGYDAAGNTTSVNGGALGSQTLTWNDQGKLAKDTTSTGATSYVYDADGNVLLRRDPGSTTLYNGDSQLVLNTATQSVSGTRYYSLGGTTLAARTSGGAVSYLTPDRQGTGTLTIDANTAAVTRRQYLPFGQDRGSATGGFPGDTGYVGGHDDTATGLETLGARLYDPVSGRFLSADPVLETTDPTQTNGYDYAGNDPVTGSDPTGQMRPPDFYGGGGDSGACDLSCQSTLPTNVPEPPIPDTSGLGGGHGGKMPPVVKAKVCDALCGELGYESDDDPGYLALIKSLHTPPTYIDGSTGPGGFSYKYHYKETVGSIAQTGSPESAMAKFEAAPTKVFPFPITQCTTAGFQEGTECTLRPGFGFYGDGRVRVSLVSPTRFTFTVISGKYIDGPGSTVSFGLTEEHGNLVLHQDADGHNSDPFAWVLTKLGVVRHVVWQEQADNFGHLLGVPQTSPRMPQH